MKCCVLHAGQAGINNGDGADFRINLREAKVIDGREYGLRITARGTYGSAYAILPWYIRFLVSPDDCPGESGTGTGLQKYILYLSHYPPLWQLLCGLCF